MVTGILYGGLALALALLVAIYRRLGALPFALRAQARRERDAGQAEALTALQAAAAAKVGAITAAISSHEEEAAARCLSEIGAAELRARVAERRTSDAIPVLGAASELVRELRHLLDELRPAGAELRPAHPTPMPDSGARLTVATGRPARCAPPAGEDEPEDEPTMVARRPRSPGDPTHATKPESTPVARAAVGGGR